MGRHINIPIFIPHLGCPNQCVFCNQRHISGVREFNADSVEEIIESALETIEDDAEVEIAFFGGSFTGIDRYLMIKLLEIASGYVKRGRVSSIRCSTRPDYINEEVLSVLSDYGVTVIELGLQSSSDAVLAASKRGHTFLDEARACKLIVDSGFVLVGQMMIGLPGSTPESEIETARFIASSGASFARIYPTVVFKDTELCELSVSGAYKPLTLDEAIERSTNAFDILLKSGVSVIRIGLCASDNLLNDETFFAGPNHPAIGEMVISEYYYRLIKSRINIFTENKKMLIRAPKSSTSKVVGQRRRNINRLKSELGLVDIKIVEDDEIPQYELKLEFEGDTQCI